MSVIPDSMPCSSPPLGRNAHDRSAADALVSTLGSGQSTELHGLVAHLLAEGLRAFASQDDTHGTASGGASWVTPPEASRMTRVPLKTILRFIRDRRIEARLRNKDPNPKQRKYLVNAEEVARVATIPVRSARTGSGMVMSDATEPLEWAKARLASSAGR